MAKKLKLIPEFKKNQRLNLPDLAEDRWLKARGAVTSINTAMARRVEESRRLFKKKFFRGDFHSHTRHSDGAGTVAETAGMAKIAGLDFQFVTDHWGITQAPECRKHKLWVGQEPGTRHHHMGILGLDHAFAPGGEDLVADVREATRLGGTVFIPHPAGWWPKKVYTEEQKKALEELPSPFLMEVINGAGNVVTAFDYTDQAAVEVWDHLLMLGRRVHAMGNTDAHNPLGIGMVWNGVFAPRCEQESILRAVRAGKSFASEAPLLDLFIGKTPMGAVAKGRGEPLRFTVADAGGLMRVRLIGDGKVRRTWHLDGKPLLTQQQKIPAGVKRYVRVEAVSEDGRRGYSNPVYLG